MLKKQRQAMPLYAILGRMHKDTMSNNLQHCNSTDKRCSSGATGSDLAVGAG